MKKITLFKNLFIFLIAFLIILLSQIYMSIYLLSYSFVIYLLLILYGYKINKFNIFSLHVLFVFFSLLFIGGRFISCIFEGLFDIEQNIVHIVDLFNQNRMIQTNFNLEESLYIFNYLILWFSAFYAGSISYQSKYYKLKSLIKICNKCYIIKLIFFISLATIITLKVFDLYKVYQNGYISLFIRSDDVVWKGAIISISKTLLISTFAFLNLSSQKNTNSRYFYLLGIVDLIIGKRGEFISNVIGAFSISKKINSMTYYKIIIYSLFVFLILNLIMIFSFRDNEFNVDISLLQSISNLFSSQGTTLGVIGYSITDIESIDLRLSIKSFVPFTNTLYSLFMGNIPFYERSIGQLISYKADEALYLNGGGLGSSIISESYLIFGPYISIVFAFLFGYILSFLEFKKNNSSLLRYLWIGSIFIIPMLPRSGISNFIITFILLLLMFPILKGLIIKKKLNIEVMK